MLGTSAPVRAEVTIMVGLGDSIGEGVQSADASFRTQPHSYLNLMARQIRIPFRLPWIKSGPFLYLGETTRRRRFFPFWGAANLAVSGTDVSSLIDRRADAVTPDEINSETDLVLFPRRGSQLEIAESLGPLLTVCWIGNNDALSAAISFDEYDASQLTPVDEFEADFEEIAARLEASGSAVLMANIPDVTKIAFLFDREDLIYFLGADYGLPEGSYTSVVAMLLIRLGLADGGLFDNPDFVLDADEIDQIKGRVNRFNEIIAETAAAHNIPVVDIHALFEEMTTHPNIFHDFALTRRFLGGIFSLDGVHPSDIGHAIIANAFIETLNDFYQTGIPLLTDEKLNEIFLEDPFVDKDGDGRARGRAGAGVLETFGPLLGISGDQEDRVPDGDFISPASSREQFIRFFEKSRARSPRGSNSWTRADSVRAFQELYSINPLR